MTRRQFTQAEIELWAKWLRHEICHICGGLEGCSHPVPERARAHLEAVSGPQLAER
jgi:UDP-N-acetylglucosamine 2-epimerase